MQQRLEKPSNFQSWMAPRWLICVCFWLGVLIVTGGYIMVTASRHYPTVRGVLVPFGYVTVVIGGILCAVFTVFCLHSCVLVTCQQRQPRKNDEDLETFSDHQQNLVSPAVMVNCNGDLVGCARPNGWPGKEPNVCSGGTQVHFQETTFTKDVSDSGLSRQVKSASCEREPLISGSGQNTVRGFSQLSDTQRHVCSNANDNIWKEHAQTIDATGGLPEKRAMYYSPSLERQFQGYYTDHPICQPINVLQETENLPQRQHVDTINQPRPPVCANCGFEVFQSQPLFNRNICPQRELPKNSANTHSALGSIRSTGNTRATSLSESFYDNHNKKPVSMIIRRRRSVDETDSPNIQIVKETSILGNEDVKENEEIDSRRLVERSKTYPKSIRRHGSGNTLVQQRSCEEAESTAKKSGDMQCSYTSSVGITVGGNSHPGTPHRCGNVRRVNVTSQQEKETLTSGDHIPNSQAILRRQQQQETDFQGLESQFDEVNNMLNRLIVISHKNSLSDKEPIDHV